MLMARDLPGRGEIVGNDPGAHLGRPGLGSRAARGLEEGIDLVLLECFLHGPPYPRKTVVSFQLSVVSKKTGFGLLFALSTFLIAGNRPPKTEG
jgi:hypothetical protein